MKRAVHRATEDDIGHRRQPLAQVHDSRAQPLPAQAGLQVKHGIPDDLYQVIKVVDGLIDPAAHQRVHGHRRSALQVEVVRRFTA